MILPFKTRINGKPTHFKEKILESISASGTPIDAKYHTVRENERWLTFKGDVHFAINNRTKDYENFLTLHTDQIKVLPISIHSTDKLVIIDVENNWPLHKKETELFARNDGFDSVDEMFEYFKGYEYKPLYLICWVTEVLIDQYKLKQ
jgi:hypothetical protein